jgi:protein TonB
MSAAMHGQDSRVIHYAMLASVVLHGLLLSFSMNDATRRAAPAPAPIVARLIQPEPVAQPRAEEPQPPAVKPAAKPIVKPLVKPKPAPTPSPVAKAEPQAAPPQPAPPVAEAPPAQSASTAPAPSPAISAPPSPVPSAGDFDAGALARYRIEVAGLAGKLKRYPRAAIDNNWAGRVVVAVTVRANGVASYSVRVGSGYKILDQQALDMISKAQARAELPAALRGREFTFEIPVDFDLKDASG